MDDARSKPLVVLVPDVMEWVLGSWAREIADANADLYDFIIFPASQFESAPKRLTEALNNADLIHCLAQSGSGLDEIRDRMKAAGSASLRVISSIHHIVCLEDVAACLDADAIVVVCNEVREQLVAAGVPDAKIHTVRKGVDTRFFVRRDPAAARHRLGIDPHDFVVGFSAKASSDDRGRKGLDIFHRVVTRLPEIVGGPVTVALTGPGWETLGADVRIPGLQWRHAPFLDPEVMPDFYSAIDVYLSTARIEGGPVPVFEAMSCETPIVCTAVGGVRDLVTDGDNGLLIPVDDVDTAVGALARLQQDPDLRRKLGRAGRDAVVERMGWQDVSSEARLAYAAVFTGPPRSRRLTRDGIRALNQELGWRGRLDWLSQVPPTSDRESNRLREPRPGPRSSEVAHIDLEELDVRPGDRVLDLGCGSGQFSLPMLKRGYRMVSADLDEPRLNLFHELASKGNLRGCPTRTDAAKLAFETACFDAVVCREMLEHIIDPAPVMDEIRRVLKPGGKLCVTVPSSRTERWFQWVNPEWLEMAGHVHVYSRKELTRVLEAGGFHVVDVRGRNFFYSFFWFFHTLAKTRHDGSGAIQEHWELAHRIQNFWRRLGNGRLKRWVEAVGDRLAPKCNVYYCAKIKP